MNNNENFNTLIVVVGPTAVGKTACCIKLAQSLKTEIISADSRQFYKELNIGTAKPDEKELSSIKHHFINSHHINEYYSVGAFEKDVLNLLTQLFKKHPNVIMTGGSGLYIDAVVKGLDEELPDPDPETRLFLDELFEKDGISGFRGLLKKLDPVFYNEVDLNNSKRLYRALEVCLTANKPYSEIRTGCVKKRPFNIIKIGLNRPREALYNRINLRVDKMIADGLLDEVKSVYKYKNHNALKTVGYRELFDYLEGKITLNEAIEKIKINTRRYAKKQITWFKRDEAINWFHPDEFDNILSYLQTQLND
jgi:tRNA dimethylallyltransferase